MNERTDSTGLPLRAMVMVLLFLGVIFLLLGFAGAGVFGSSDYDSSVGGVHARAPPARRRRRRHRQAGEPAQAEVQVYNISAKAGVAENTADQLT